jgi:signal peptidase II
MWMFQGSLSSRRPSAYHRGAPLLGAAAVAALDQWIKRLVVETRPDFTVIPGLFSVSFGTNTGVAFGLFREFPLGVTLLGLVLFAGILLYIIRAAPGADGLERAGLALLLGGAAGNLSDRFRLGYVVDYLDVYVGEYHWPAFNLADSAITVSVGLLVLALRRRPARPMGALPEGADSPSPSHR